MNKSELNQILLKNKQKIIDHSPIIHLYVEKAVDHDCSNLVADTESVTTLFESPSISTTKVLLE